MSETFDPYFKWLGIRPEHQPPDHYRLLGLQRFESDAEVIENAADAKMSFLRSFRLGERMAIAERLLNELAEAKVCLLKADRKQAYDAKLRLETADAPETVKTAAPPRAAVLVAKALAPVGPAGSGPVAAEPVANGDHDDNVELLKSRSLKHRVERRPQLSTAAMLAVVASAAVLALVVLWPALRGSTESVAGDETSATATLRPTLPPIDSTTSPTPDGRTPPADAGGVNSKSPLDTNPATPIPAAAETALPADDQPDDPQLGDPVAAQLRPATPQPVVPQPMEAAPPVAVVAPPNTTELQPQPAEATDPQPETDEPIEPAVAPPDFPPATAKRRAIPSAADQATIEANINEVYQTAKIDKPADRKQLTEKLLDDAVATGDAPNEQFVMFRMAAGMAAAAGDVARASLAVDLIDERFQIDAVAMRLSLLEQAVKAPSTAEEKQQALSASLPLLDAGLQANRFAEVERILVPAQAAAKRLKDKRLSDQLAELRKRGGTLARDHERAKAAFAVLQTTPDDPQANLTVGSFWCFAKGDWQKGLPFLSKGADQALAGVAASEIKQPTAPADRAGLADAWYKAARNAKDYAQEALLRHAAGWYEVAIPELTGLLATAAQKNLDEIQKSLAKEEVAAAPKTRARIVAVCDSEFELYLNGQPLLRGNSFGFRFGGRFGGGFPGRNGGDNNGNNNDGNNGNNHESQEAERELKAGDVLIAKCTNQRNERGFACVIEFLDDKATIATTPGGAWKVFAPRDQDQWFNPNGIAAVDSAKPADGDKHLKIFEETRLRCLSIWGSNPSRAYLVLKLR